MRKIKKSETPVKPIRVNDDRTDGCPICGREFYEKDVSFGVGAGASTQDKKSGGAGGMSGKMSPSAVLAIKNGQIKLVNIKNQDSVTKVLDMVPELVDKLTKKEPMSSDEARDIAFPDGEIES